MRIMADGSTRRRPHKPHAFTVGLARGAASEGVTIFEQSPALNLTPTPTGWRIKTPTGEVHAEKVVLATAAHTGSLWPELRRSIVPVTSYQAATEPMGDLANTILPGNEASSDTRFDLRYFRKDREGGWFPAAHSPFRPVRRIVCLQWLRPGCVSSSLICQAEQ